MSKTDFSAVPSEVVPFISAQDKTADENTHALNFSYRQVRMSALLYTRQIHKNATSERLVCRPSIQYGERKLNMWMDSMNVRIKVDTTRKER